LVDQNTLKLIWWTKTRQNDFGRPKHGKMILVDQNTAK
jgi:hypothetical protein